MQKNNEIEILRAVGIIFVIMAHLNVFLTWNPSWVSLMNSNFQYWGGVDLFFCVSGFVITKSIYNKLLSSSDGVKINVLKTFWIKRAFRLLPASLFFITLTFILSLSYNNHGAYGSPSANFADIITQLFQLSNFRYHLCSTGAFECGKNSIYWSLSLEEQFYILMPLLVLALRNKTPAFLIAIILIQAPLIRPMFSLPWMIRTDSIAWGCLIAIASNSQFYNRIKPAFLHNKLASMVVSMALILSLAFITHGHGFVYNLSAMAMVSALMVFIASYNDGLLFKYIKNNTIALWIGSRSYSIYLCHVPCFYFVSETIQNIFHRELNGSDTFRMLFFGLLLTCLIAESSFRILETPARRYGKELLQKRFSKTAF